MLGDNANNLFDLINFEILTFLKICKVLNEDDFPEDAVLASKLFEC